MRTTEEKKLIIFDLSANTHRNDPFIIQKIINDVSRIDSRIHHVVFKAQLFRVAGKNTPCTHKAFDFMYQCCKEVGYHCTASVFDIPSVKFLINNYDVPFVKFACNAKTNHLHEFIPYRVKIFQSAEPAEYQKLKNDTVRTWMVCVPKYPAPIDEYPYCTVVSDHTIGLDLFKRNDPTIWEKHIKLADSTGLDAGPFAITPGELNEVL